MSVQIYHASIGENGKTTGGAVGDQTGKEVCIRSWYSKPWNVLLRYNNPNVAKKAAEIGKKLCQSNLVGYDQDNRNSLYKQLKANNFDVDKYIKSGVKTETDCSAFQYAIWCCLIPAMRSDSNAPTTRTMKSFFGKFGFKAYTGSAYLTSVELKHGDIHLKEGSHVVGIIGNEAKTYSGTFPTGTIKKGTKGTQVKYMQQFLNWYGNFGLVVDGDCGPKSVAAIKTFQSNEGLVADGIWGAKSLAKAKTICR